MIFGSPDFEYPMGNIQIVAKSTAEMYHGDPVLERLGVRHGQGEPARAY